MGKEALTVDIGQIKERLAEILLDCGWDTQGLDLYEIRDGIFSALGLSSVEALEYLFQVENEYGIEIADEDLNANLVRSLEVLAEYVVTRL